MKSIHIDVLDPASIEDAIRELREYREWLKAKADELVQRLAELGATGASLGFSRVFYDGNNSNVSITVEKRGERSYAIVASGETVLILEFGAGIRYGYGHPQAGEFGYGPGTYPGQKHALDPRGWWTPDGIHTYGNPPAMAMYNTARNLESEIERVAKEVFSS